MATKPVIAGADGSQESLRAVEWAAREAVLRGTSLRIVTIAVLPARMAPNPATPDTVAGTIEHSMRQALATAAQRAAAVEPALSVDTDSPSLSSLLSVLGAAYALGADVDTEALFADATA